MKKYVFLLILIFLFLIPLFSSSLSLIPLDSDIYEKVELLYLLEGKNLPNNARPWTESDLKSYLDKIVPTSLNTKEIKESLNKKLISGNENVKFKASIDITPQLFIHTNVNDFNSVNDIANVKDFDKKFFDAGLNFLYKDNLALFMNIDLGSSPIDLYKIKEETLENGTNYIGTIYNNRFAENYFSTTIPFLFSTSLDFLNFPSRAYASIGSPAIRVDVARDNLKWGKATLGGMVLGDTLNYHDYIALVFSSPSWFNYHFLLDFFTPFQDLIKGNREELDSGLRCMLAHRFEFSLLKNKFNLVMTDAIMYYSGSTSIIPSLLNPMAFLHNQFIAGNSNSLATIGLSYTPVKGLSIYGEIGIDDLALPNEPSPPEKGSTADGLGLLLGAKYTLPLEKNLLSFTSEFVYTTPFMFHRATGLGEIGGNDFYFVSSSRNFLNNSLTSLVRYLSFPFGSDSIAALFKVDYFPLNTYKVGGAVFLMAHGIIDAFSPTSWYSGENEEATTPTTFNPFSTESGDITYTLLFNGNGEYTVLPYLKVGASINLITRFVGKTVSFDAQTTIKAKMSWDF